MNKRYTLKQNYEFRRAYDRGSYKVSALLVTYAFKRRRKEPAAGEITRAGVTSSKRIGNAVTRNRARRVIREAYRSLSGELKGGFDLVFVARQATAGSKSQAVGRDMRRQLKELGVLRAKTENND